MEYQFPELAHFCNLYKHVWHSLILYIYIYRERERESFRIFHVLIILVRLAYFYLACAYQLVLFGCEYALAPNK